MVVYKTIKRHRNIEYILTQNRWNSIAAHVEAYSTKDDKFDGEVVATINNKTSTVEYHEDKLKLAPEVKEAIELYL